MTTCILNDGNGGTLPQSRVKALCAKRKGFVKWLPSAWQAAKMAADKGDRI